MESVDTSRSIACIGAGHWGKNLVRNFDALGSLGWICEADPAIRAGMADTYPHVELLQDPEDVFGNPAIPAVAIATPAETHATLVHRALEAGKDVFVEKPLCLDLDVGKELVDLAERTGRVLMVGHLLWYHPAVVKLKALIEEGVLGRIRYLSSNRLNFGKIRREENILWSFAPHDVSVMLGLLEETPDVVRSHGGNYLHERIADVTTSVFSFPSGARAHIFVSWLHPEKEQKLVVVGDKGMAVFNDLAPEHKLVLYSHTVDWRGNLPVASKAEGTPVDLPETEPLRAECEHFLHCIESRETPRTDGREGLRVLAVLDQCQRSLDDPLEVAAPPAELRTGAASADGAPDRPYFLHESSYVDEGAVIGDDTKIWHFSHVLPGSVVGSSCSIGQNVVIGPDVTIGDGVKIQNNVSVYKGVTLEDYVFCGPSMVFTNVHNPRSEIRRMDELRPTLVRRGASLGANCTIVCGVTIGRYAFVGAGAVVTRDVPDHALVVGNPGRVVGWMSESGERIPFGPDSDVAEVAGVRYRKINENEVVKL